LFMGGLPRSDIARRLGVSRGAVTHMLQRLRPLLIRTL
jgi:Mn-dependent DtxR family transcriptional regulator